jgi:hypothetical protein
VLFIDIVQLNPGEISQVVHLDQSYPFPIVFEGTVSRYVINFIVDILAAWVRAEKMTQPGIIDVTLTYLSTPNTTFSFTTPTGIIAVCLSHFSLIFY